MSKIGPPQRLGPPAQTIIQFRRGLLWIYTSGKPSNHWLSGWHITHHRWATSSSQDFLVFTSTGRWWNAGLSGGVKEAIYIKKEWPSLKRGGGLRMHISPSYNAAITQEWVCMVLTMVLVTTDQWTVDQMHITDHRCTNYAPVIMQR